VSTSQGISGSRRRRRTHSAEFKAKVVAACRQPGVSIAAVALANQLNANLLRRWVVTQERAQAANGIEAISAAPADLIARAFVPVEVERRPCAATAQAITIELRRGATVVKVGWPLAAMTDCAVWLRELLR
jgi:transposase-like protein